ncbi:MAG: hypothetical protein HKN17_08870 [Rhodothermales bacterium]|nr:hypothetical protein [Rhodothermales bacterium]
MATIHLPSDFSEFLRLLSDHDVRYLLIGGHAVAFHGYVRSTADMDLWVPTDIENAGRLVEAMRKFGFDVPDLKPELFLKKEKLVRMGLPPMRIEIMTDIPGVSFEPAFANREQTLVDGIGVDVIGLEELKANKRATGRHKDLDDLENLP